jgi:capsid protein
VPRVGADQRVRHQRPRKPRQLYRGHRPPLPRHAPRPDASPQLAAEVQAVLDEFAEQNRWQQRQQEIVRRKDRDGECFLRYFDARDGSVRIRFVEPEQVSTPPAEAGNPAASFGIVTDAQDVETVRGYYVDGRWIDAAEIQHRKANVDANVKRGIPLFTYLTAFPCASQEINEHAVLQIHPEARKP